MSAWRRWPTSTSNLRAPRSMLVPMWWRAMDRILRWASRSILGGPILYSLGNFIFQNDTVEVFPAEAYQRFGLPHEATPADFLDTRTDGGKRGFPASPEFWEGLAAECEFRDRALSALRLYPLDLGHGRR